MLNIINFKQKKFTFLNFILVSLILLFTTCYGSTTSSSAIKKYSSVKEFIADQKIIRVFADNSPGYGNQTASMNVMVRLRQMGFKGTYEFIYSNLTTDKITSLFGLPNNIPDIYNDENRNIRFIKIKPHIERVLNNTIEMVPLGITGANDSGECSLATKDGVTNLDEYGPLCTDSANFFSTKLFIEFDPYMGEQSLEHHEGTTFYTYNPSSSGKPSYPYQGDSYKKYFVMPVADLKQAITYLKIDPNGQTLIKERPALKTFIHGMKMHHFNVFPVYGYTVQINSRCPECFPGNILQIITAARYAQLHGKNNFYKPLIIPVFFDYQKEAEQISQIINHNNWGDYETPGSEQARAIINQLSLPQSFSIADVKDKETIQRIKQLRPGQVLLLSLGTLPKDVFDGLYTYTDSNIWPQIREGANSFNSLILTGRPHFRCLDNWEIGFDLIEDQSLKSHFENFYQKNGICDGMNTWQANNDIYKTLGEFIIDAANKNSSLSHYFEQLKTEAEKPENDRIYYALEEA